MSGCVQSDRQINNLNLSVKGDKILFFHYNSGVNVLYVCLKLVLRCTEISVCSKIDKPTLRSKTDKPIHNFTKLTVHYFVSCKI